MVFSHLSSGAGKLSIFDPPDVKTVGWLAGLVMANPSSFNLDGEVVALIFAWKLTCYGQGTNVIERLVRSGTWPKCDFAKWFSFSSVFQDALSPHDQSRDAIRGSLILLFLGGGVHHWNRALFATLDSGLPAALDSTLSRRWSWCFLKLMKQPWPCLGPWSADAWYHSKTTLPSLALERFKYKRERLFPVLKRLMVTSRLDPNEPYSCPWDKNGCREVLWEKLPDWSRILRPPWFATIMYQWWEAAKLLVSDLDDVNCYWRNFTPLGLALQLATRSPEAAGALDLARFLLDHGADVRLSSQILGYDEAKETLLVVFLQLRREINEGFHASAVSPVRSKILLTLTPDGAWNLNYAESGNSILGRVLEAGDLTLLLDVLARRADPNQAFTIVYEGEEKEYVPLSYVTQHRQPDDRIGLAACYLLLMFGASTATTVNGINMFAVAIRANDPAVLRLLYAHCISRSSAPPIDDGGRMLLQYLAETHGDAETIAIVRDPVGAAKGAFTYRDESLKSISESIWGTRPYQQQRVAAEHVVCAL